MIKHYLVRLIDFLGKHGVRTPWTCKTCSDFADIRTGQCAFCYYDFENPDWQECSADEAYDTILKKMGIR